MLKKVYDHHKTSTSFFNQKPRPDPIKKAANIIADPTKKSLLKGLIIA